MEDQEPIVLHLHKEEDPNHGQEEEEKSTLVTPNPGIPAVGGEASHQKTSFTGTLAVEPGRKLVELQRRMKNKWS